MNTFARFSPARTGYTNEHQCLPIHFRACKSRWRERFGDKGDCHGDQAFSRISIFTYIVSLHQFSHRFTCSKCRKLHKSGKALHRHKKNRSVDQKYRYLGKTYKVPAATVFEELEEERIFVQEEDRYFPFRAVFFTLSHIFQKILLRTQQSLHGGFFTNPSV